MTEQLEDLVRAAQRRAADSVSPEEVRAAIPARVARLRRRRAVTAIATVAAAVLAVLVAVPLLPRPQHKAPLPPSVPVSASPAAGAMPLRYTATWLPPGFTEHGRITPVPGRTGARFVLARTWTAGPMGTLSAYTDQGITLIVGALTASPTTGEPVDVNGAHGLYSPATTQTPGTVSWHVGAVAFTVDDARLALPEDTLLHIARAVRPDTTTTRSPVHVGWLPPGFAASTVSLSGDGSDSWQSSAFAESPDGGNLFVQLAPGTTAPTGGALTTVDGRPARIRDADGDQRTHFLVLNVDDKLLTVSLTWPAGASPPPMDDLVRVAAATTIDNDPTQTTWIGH
jgi:hypothetical protein